MNIVFLGTAEFAVPALQALLDARHAVDLVLTQPDRPAGRALALRSSAVKMKALEHDLSVLQPASLKSEDVVAAIAAHTPDALVVAAYGLMIPRNVLDVARLGGINIHASLLPRWRGAAPIQRAILAGDAVTGVTMMSMDAGLDTGAILLQRSVPIGDDDTAKSLHDRLANLGAEMIVETLAAPLVSRPQDEAEATYAQKIDKRDAVIDWKESAASIMRKIRAFNPAPGASSAFRGAQIKIWRAAIENGISASPGTVCDVVPGGIVVACGSEGLRLIEMQRAGGRRLHARAFAVGHNVVGGTRFGD